MISLYRLLVVVGSIACLVLLSGCVPKTINVTAAPTATSVPSPTATIAPSPTGTENSSTATVGLVTLDVDKPSYQKSDPITVKLSNQSSKTIYFSDHLTNCTVILLQRHVNGSWAATNFCRLEIATRLHELGKGQCLSVKLVSNQWLPGLYRARLGYSTMREHGPLMFIYSSTFEVG